MSSLFRRNHRTENLTVLLTDIKGFTERTAAQSREESARWLQTHEGLLGPVVKAFGGVRRKDIGDAWLVTFSSPTDAVRCAMAVQDRLWAYNRRARPGDRIDVRSVLTQGEIQLRGREVFGAAVSQALDLEKHAESGEVLLTESVYLAMNRNEAPIEEVGILDVEDVLERVLLYRASKLDEEDGAPPYENRTLPPRLRLETSDRKWMARRTPSIAEETAASTPAGIEVQPKPAKALLADLGISSWLDNPRRRFLVVALGAGLLAALFLLGLLLMIWARDPVRAIERMAAKGDIEPALQSIEALSEHPNRAADVQYLRGIVAWQQERPAEAAASYRRAINSDESGRYARNRVITRHMLEALQHEACMVRRSAAITLGLTGQKKLAAALGDAIEAEASRPAGPLGIRRARCDFEGAALEAIKKLDGGGAGK